MSVEGRYRYRYQFLKSEKWQTLKLICIARDEGKCVLCGKYNIANDAHHLFYRKRWDQTCVDDLITLCRECHDKVHLLGGDVICKRVWENWKWLWRIKGVGRTDVCYICRTPNVKLAKLIIKEDKFTPDVCQECSSKYWELREKNGWGAWKAFDNVKEDRRPNSVRTFWIERLREYIDVGGVMRKHDRDHFKEALVTAGVKIREFLSVDSKPEPLY